MLKIFQIAFSFLLCAGAFPLLAQERPLTTDDAELLPTGSVRAELGIEFLQGQRYSLSGLDGNLTRLGVASVHVGTGEYAEFQISGVMQDFLSISRQTTPVIPPTAVRGNSTNDFGDLILATKMKLFSEKGGRPAMAFKFAVELPNAKHDSGLGADETEFYAWLLFTKYLGRARLSGDLGFAILGNPVLASRQTDPLLYGVSLKVPLRERISLFGEVSGRQGPFRVGNENQTRIRAGFQMMAGGLRWDIAGIAGLRTFDPRTGITVGVTYLFQAFNRPHSPTIVK